MAYTMLQSNSPMTTTRIKPSKKWSDQSVIIFVSITHEQIGKIVGKLIDAVKVKT